MKDVGYFCKDSFATLTNGKQSFSSATQCKLKYFYITVLAVVRKSSLFKFFFVLAIDLDDAFYYRINNLTDLDELGLKLNDLSMHGNGREMVMEGLQHNSMLIIKNCLQQYFIHPLYCFH